MAGTLSGFINGVIQGFPSGQTSNGVLYATGVQQFLRNAALGGDGALVGPTVAQRPALPGTSGGGTLSNTVWQNYIQNGNLNAAGALTATRTSQYYAQTSALLAASGALASTAVGQMATNAYTTGGGTLTGTAQPAQVTIDAVSISGSNSSSFSYPYTWTWTHPANTGNRVIVAVDMWNQGTLPSFTVTVGGQGTTYLGYSSRAGSGIVALYDCAAPALGDLTVSVTSTSFSGTTYCLCTAVSLKGVTGVGSTVAVSSANTNSMNLTVPSAVHGLSIAFGGSNHSNYNNNMDLTGGQGPYGSNQTYIPGAYGQALSSGQTGLDQGALQFVGTGSNNTFNWRFGHYGGQYGDVWYAGSTQAWGIGVPIYGT
jgi:hypothetical protein